MKVFQIKQYLYYQGRKKEKFKNLLKKIFRNKISKYKNF